MRRRRTHSRLFTLSLIAGLPAVIVSILLLRSSAMSSPARWALTLLIVGFWLGFSRAVHSASRYHLRTLSNLLAALREGDYSFRLRGGKRDDPYGEVILELNALSEALRRQRVDDIEATALLRKVMGEIDVAVFAFDADHQLRLVNAAGETLLGGEAGELLGRPAVSLGLETCLGGSPARTISLQVSGTSRRWELRRGRFRQHGRPHHLLVLSDVSRALRAEELTAWKRLIRVIGHELNNSLAPIRSLAGSLERLTAADPLPDDWQADLQRGLGVIASRAESLNRFMGAYSKLAKMPEPSLAPVDVGGLVRRVAHIETRMQVEVVEGASVTVSADQDQLEQLLINLVRNAVDASSRSGGRVRMGWGRTGARVDIWVIDEGPGLSDTQNLFVPFYTTKAGGSGIGLFLCRQIAEAHGGTVALANRLDRPGCEAHVFLPAPSS